MAGERVVPGILGFDAHLVFLLLIWKAFELGLTLFYARLMPGAFSLGNYRANFHRYEQPFWTQRFSTWDGEHYLFLSQHGYQSGSLSAAFYPLWPGLIHFAGRLTGGHSLVAALILANILSLVALLLFHRFVAVNHGANTANFALALLVAYPGSLFFQFPYSESLFLLLIVLFFIGLSRENYWLVAVAGFLLPLTRATGIFCLLPLMWIIWEKAKNSNVDLFSLQVIFRRVITQRAFFVCLAPLLGYMSYFGIMYAFTGNPFEGFDAQKNYINQPSIMNILNVFSFIGAFLNIGWEHGMTNSPVDRVFFVVFVLYLPFLWRLNKPYFFYALGSGLIPAMSNYFFSYTRLLVLCFPLFIILGEKLGRRENRLYFAYVMAILAAVQITFLIRHINFNWAG